jgi:hypothetical protein
MRVQRHLGARKRRATGVPAGSGRAVDRTPVGRHQSVLGQGARAPLSRPHDGVVQVHQNTLFDATPGTDVWCSFPAESCWLIPGSAAGVS